VAGISNQFGCHGATDEAALVGSCDVSSMKERKAMKASLRLRFAPCGPELATMPCKKDSAAAMAILARVSLFPGARRSVVTQSPELEGKPVDAGLATP